MEDSILDDSTLLQVFDDDALEKRRRDSRVPDTFGIYHHDRASSTHPETWRFAPLHSRRPEQQTLTIQERGEKRVKRATAAIR